MSTTTAKAPARMQYELCPLCSAGGFPVGCPRCNHHGIIPTGITAGQVEGLVREAQRLDWREGDIARIRDSPPKEPIIFIVTLVADQGRQLAGEILTHTRITLIEARAINCIRVGNIDRKDGQPC